MTALADTRRNGSRMGEYDELFRRVLASMNAGRWRTIPESEHSLIWEVCAETVDLQHATPPARVP